MIDFLFRLYSLGCIFLPCLLYQCLFLKRQPKEQIPLSFLVWRYLLILYLYLVIDVTGVGTLGDLLSYPELIRPDEISLIPLKDPVGLQSVLNSVMFMPLGFLLPLIWQRFRRLHYTLLLGASFSLGIELLQLFNRRVTDVDDLLMNTLGTLAGYLIWVLWQKLSKRSSKEIRALGSWEPCMYLFLSLAGNFFLYHWRFFLRFL
ncbi:antibiotic resistance protein VanZ [Enterococcus florum]|uniref:Antibiotic resistance protein VanZ n=1 Tax=Enterococcus florum TaxID=2480627 RepID=A0A4P5P368_9ENTE|nr:VanZ family protein [Enterococcus florum]GCF92167.1 antibiotic resistance protein VanZ [Enterococcus florum]